MVDIYFPFPKASKSTHSPRDQVLQLRCLKSLDVVAVYMVVGETEYRDRG
jgi:hypothetical protein